MVIFMLIRRMFAAQKLAFSGNPLLCYSKQANDLLSCSFWKIGELAAMLALSLDMLK